MTYTITLDPLSIVLGMLVGWAVLVLIALAASAYGKAKAGK